MCLVCRGTGLEILQVPSLEPLMSYSSASAGLPVMDSSEGGAHMPICHMKYHVAFLNPETLIQQLDNALACQMELTIRTCLLKSVATFCSAERVK